MATPYLVTREEEVPSTQDLARQRFGSLPVQVVAGRQSRGRGRGGADWINAPLGLATSVAFRVTSGERRPISLLAGVAAVRSVAGFGLKWPNDLIFDGEKVGGILVEVSDHVVVAGLGLNLWWPDPPPGMRGLFSDEPDSDPGPGIAGIWGAELLDLIDLPGWPSDEYRRHSLTLGRTISWSPSGRGTAIDIDEDGGLVVDVGGSPETLHAGAVSHIRS
jgi:BirA family transcriptional regulator, biotin operon repressor / biotin---[acetyl-CoA-carboxylase] ligase